jgi:pimeloyl-ACP methyl ester carboxylesterase
LAAVAIAERTLEAGGIATHVREAAGTGPVPIMYLHGVPTAGWEWDSFLERTGGVAPDLPGFGQSAKPGDFDHSIAGYDRWIEQFADAAGMERFSLVVHDWGGVGLAFAQRHPERIERLVIFNCVPFLPGYRWHWVARMWRRPVIGEALMATASKTALRVMSRPANATPGPLPGEFIDRLWAGFDRDTRRAILRWYRAAPEDVLARSGARLGDVRCPALVLWSTADPYIGAEFGRRYADALGGETTLELVERAGHWSWLDRPELVERAAAFLLPPHTP